MKQPTPYVGSWHSRRSRLLMGAKMHLWSSAIIQWEISHVKFVFTAVNHVLIEILMMFSTRIVIPNINCLHRSAVSYIWDEHEICKFLLRWFKEELSLWYNAELAHNESCFLYLISDNWENQHEKPIPIFLRLSFFLKLNLIWKCLQTLL